jgi:hypothetical protein
MIEDVPASQYYWPYEDRTAYVEDFKYAECFPRIQMVIWKRRLEPESPSSLQEGEFSTTIHCAVIVMQPVSYPVLERIMRSDTLVRKGYSADDCPPKLQTVFGRMQKYSGVLGFVDEDIRRITFRNRGQLLERGPVCNERCSAGLESVLSCSRYDLEVVIDDDADVSVETLIGLLRLDGEHDLY